MTSFSHKVSPMKKATIAIAVVLISLVCCVWVFGWGADHPLDQPVGWSPDWPEGTRELVNREGRVHGYFVNACDIPFFAGDTNAFNEFLEQYAVLRDTPLTLVLHPGRGMAGSPWDKEKKIPFEWQVNILCRGWSRRYPEPPTADEAKYVVLPELWLGGQIELDKVKVPLNVEVKSSGKIERFIAAHEGKQQAQNLSD